MSCSPGLLIESMQIRHWQSFRFLNSRTRWRHSMSKAWYSWRRNRWMFRNFRSCGWSSRGRRRREPSRAWWHAFCAWIIDACGGCPSSSRASLQRMLSKFYTIFRTRPPISWPFCIWERIHSGFREIMSLLNKYWRYCISRLSCSIFTSIKTSSTFTSFHPFWSASKSLNLSTL